MGIFDFFKGDSKKKESKNTLDLLKSKIWVKETKDSYCSLQFYEGGYGLHSITENITLISPNTDNFTYTLNKKKLIISYNDGTYVEIIIKEINETKLVTYIEKYNNEKLYDILKYNHSTFFSSGILESLPDSKKNEVLDNVVDNQDNKDYIFSEVHNAMKKNICDKFNPLELAKKFNLPIEDLEIDYWYDIIVERTKLDDLHSYTKETPINEKLSQNIKGHYDTYAIKFNRHDNTIKDVFDQMSVRVITFGHIYQNLKTHSENTFNTSFKGYLNKEGVNHEEFMSNINLMIMHARASLYSSISYAMNHTISKNDIINWFPHFEEDKISLKSNSLDFMEIIFNDSKKEEYNPDASHHFSRVQIPTLSDTLNNEVLDEDGIWTLEKIEEEMAVVLNQKMEAILSIEFLKKHEIVVNNVPGNEYVFISNLVDKIFDLINKDPNWTFKNNAENRLYDLRYNSEVYKNLSNSEHSFFLESAKFELNTIDVFLSKKLNDYDLLNKENNFLGYDKLDQTISRCRLLVNYLSDLNLKISKKSEENESVLRVNFDDTEDIGIVTHYKGKPFTGIAYHNHKDSDIKFDETNMIDGLKHGVFFEYSKDGSLDSWGLYKDDIFRCSIVFEVDKVYGDSININGSTLNRFYVDEEIRLNWKKEGEEDVWVKFSLDEIMGDNFNEKSENYDVLIRTNYSFMEMGIKQYYMKDQDEVWVPGMIPEKKDDKVYHENKLFSGVCYGLHNNGKLKEYSSYSEGILNGVSKFFDKEGNLEEINYWIDGEWYTGF